jgi:hypothetical protein
MYQTVRRYITEDGRHHSHYCKNLSCLLLPYIMFIYYFIICLDTESVAYYAAWNDRMAGE